MLSKYSEIVTFCNIKISKMFFEKEAILSRKSKYFKARLITLN